MYCFILIESTLDVFPGVRELLDLADVQRLEHLTYTRLARVIPRACFRPRLPPASPLAMVHG